MLLACETGTGKSQTARAIHAESARKDDPFVIVGLGAVPTPLIETELFGHEKGAFTGADTRRLGAFEGASGCTTFLDEIGELTPELQPKLLRAIENKAIRRLGSHAQQPVDARVIVATNRDLRADVNVGRFRSDLCYRLAVIQIALPPLRQRPEDVPALAERLLRQMGAWTERVAALLSAEMLARLGASAWPGKVRELRHCLALKQ